ncbi:MAG TPA: ABC transporter permease [Sporichthyaceae bacterium]|nr:ABC transporter permease [Sporichthyaceae bacterium]
MTTTEHAGGGAHPDAAAQPAAESDSGPRWATEIRWAISDAAVLTGRNLIHTVRVRELWPFLIVQPVVFVLLFSWVFGGAITLPGGGSYRSFLMAGVFALAVAFATYPTAVGMAFDMHLGLMDRFRTMPVHPAAIFIGRTLGDLARMALSIAVMACCGLGVGWRVSTGFWHGLAGFALLAAFGFAMSWVGAYLGLVARSLEAAQSLPMLWLFPLTFVSDVFVPTQHMPRAIRAIADWNPVSAVATAIRSEWGNPHPFVDPHSFLARHSVALTLVWSVALTALGVFACTRRMRAVAA